MCLRSHFALLISCMNRTVPAKLLANVYAGVPSAHDRGLRPAADMPIRWSLPHATAANSFTARLWPDGRQFTTHRTRNIALCALCMLGDLKKGRRRIPRHQD
ncbi:hypothetical protein PYCCODRAFT_336542 [Trametes coccinea BRFM310]|uniref:Uncharacterized protein n=1 Tax=Trametes coccinea (strain BRFM310) TaxID=1353009 RepID=A0A1Y2J2K9_TRAC3|nr:hypothetical protein PYCCODRAFT_336542 [Trametes coccinea BRFM310]